MPRQHVKPVALVAYSINQASAATGIRAERLSAAAKNGAAFSTNPSTIFLDS